MNSKVLWFDDEHATLEIILEEAAMEGIDLIGVTNAEDGINRLRKDFRLFDAVLVDGLFFRKADHSGGNVTDKALDDVAKTITELTGEKVLPWFILSGQTSFTKETNKFADVHKDNQVFDKAKKEDRARLWMEIKLRVSESLDFQTKKFHSAAFEALEFLQLGRETENHFVDILKSIGRPTYALQSELYFGQIRIVLEQAFRYANTMGFLHDVCIKAGRVNLTESSLFLSGLNTRYLDVKCAKPHFPKLISDFVVSILFIVGSAAHSSDASTPKTLDTHAHVKEVGTPYLLYSLTFQLFDFLIWFKSYCQANPNVAANKALWETLPTDAGVFHTGTVQQDAKGNYYCGSYLLPQNLKGYEVGDSIRILASSPNTKSNKFLYPNFASKFEKNT